MSTKDVWDLFSKYGDVDSVFLVKDRKTKRPRGFGFVMMNSDDDAKKAIAGLNGTVVREKTISVFGYSG